MPTSHDSVTPTVTPSATDTSTCSSSSSDGTDPPGDPTSSYVHVPVRRSRARTVAEGFGRASFRLEIRALPLTVPAEFATDCGLPAGCGPADNKGGQAKDQAPSSKDKSVQVADAKKDEKRGHDHSGWWCDEHGVPEAECSMCSAKVAAEFKKKGDWCEEHDRAKSQCFLCNPKFKEEYAKKYRAVEGKDPPPTEDEEKTKQGAKK